MRRDPARERSTGGRGAGWGGTSDSWEKEVDSPSGSRVGECEQRHEIPCSVGPCGLVGQAQGLR